MSKIIKIDVKYPNYGWTEVDIECVVAVLPAKRRVLFENMYWDLDEENFRILYNTWRGVDVSVEPESFEVKNGYYVCIDEGANNINAAVRFKVGGVYRYDDGMIVDGGTLGMSDDTVKKFFRPATEEEVSVSFLPNLASEQKDVPPEIQQVINDHFDEMLNEEPELKNIQVMKEMERIGKDELTEFEEILKTIVNSYAQPIGRKTEDVMTDRGAKSVAKTLLSIARKQLQPEFDKELELAYKNQDEVVYNRGYDKGREDERKEKVDKLISEEDIEQLIGDYEDEGHFRDLVLAYKQGVERVVEFIKEREYVK